jgi:hypothetical protein
VAHGCDEAQGFYLSEAVRGEAFLELFGMFGVFRTTLISEGTEACKRSRIVI